ncbi:MAG: ParB/RepB/Spo0J family partition protein [Clostridia bacterium]|nr:ParB/RepB/Spo0J family partition protein [Clostridia bacterium]
MLGGVELVKNNSPNLNKNDLKNDIEQIVEIGIDKLKNFEKHPFKVVDETLEELITSITENGVTTPLIVRTLKDGNYEIVSGHRRKRACELLEITKIPCIVRDISRDEAIIQMVDSNIQREKVLPSERAFAYKMKLDAIKRNAGRPKKENSRQLVGNLESAEIIGKETGESGRQIQRYIRLTELIPKLLDLVDDDTVAFNTGVELSYLTQEEQENLLETMEIEERTPSLSQALRMKELSKQGKLDMDAIFRIMIEAKGNEQEQLKFKVNDLKSYFPKHYTIKQMENVIQKLLENYQKQWQKKLQDRDSR